jgi:hypothetical protein
MNDLLSIKRARNLAIILILVFTSIIVIDSTIVKFLGYSDFDLSTSSSNLIFTSFYVISIGGSIILLSYLRKLMHKLGYRSSLNERVFQIFIFATEILMASIILILILQMTFYNKYSILLLHASTYLSHGSSLLFLISLVIILIQWIQVKRNYMILLYVVSLSLISTSVVLSLIYLEYQFSRSMSPDRKPYPIHLFIIRQENTAWIESLHTAFDFTYLSSFIVTWIATAVLLNHYRRKVGTIKYFILIALPLVYYTFTFNGYLGNVLSPMMINSPVTVGVLYVLVFSATKQVGSFLFSLSFLTAAVFINREHLRISLLMSAMGIALLYGSIEVTTLQYRLYPPFGLITESFMPLGSFLLFTGILNTSTRIAQDADLRREISKNAKDNLMLFRSMGIRQMEKELINRFKYMEKRATISGNVEEIHREEEDVREIVRDVLNELNKSKIMYKDRNHFSG